MDILVRAKVNRLLGKKSPKLFATMRSGRLARMQARFRRLSLPAPGKLQEDLVQVSAIHVREVQPPAGERPVQWYLLTNQEIATLEQAIEVVGYYVLRWRVEDMFRVLKSGCAVERLGMRQAKSLHNAITLTSPFRSATNLRNSPVAIFGPFFSGAMDGEIYRIG